MIITTRINGKEIVNGNSKFPAFTAKINGKWFKIKFTQECEKAPKTRGVYDLTFDTLKSSIQKGKKYVTTNGKEGYGNDIIWIKELVNVVKYTEEQLAEINAKDVEAAFGKFEAIDTDEDLPF